ncbi:MAG: porphobilinogen synthase [Bdellovibrionales bacterium]|nr:porphobilinogen synthase [Bdellovibrionales bacterium]
MKIPFKGRRLRANAMVRELVRETTVEVSDLIQPYFVVDGNNREEPIESMPGISRYSIDCLLKDLDSLSFCEINKIILFGVPETKDSQGSSAWSKGNLVERALSEIKRRFPNITVIADVCLCAYTDHGHCGHLSQSGTVDNQKTLELLAKASLSYAHAGADIIAPSDMMDGRIGFIRQALDANGFEYTPMLSYAAKYCSAFYGPFRDAAHSSPKRGDRKTYQMDVSNRREAAREIAADISEGADMIMVKPALAYLDIIRLAKSRFNVPVFAYQVSGEYSMIRAMGEMGWGDENALALETLTSIKRAGADKIITYFAKSFKQMISEGQS